MAKILIVDDDQVFRRMIFLLIERKGHEVIVAEDIRRMRKLVSEGPFDVVFLDVNLPDGNGLDLVPEVRSWPGSPEVIIITGSGHPDGAEMAIRSGAWDYIEKSSSVGALSLPLARALEYRAEKSAAKPKVALQREGIIGDSPAIKSCLDLVAQAAESDASVLITGETGTGKELFARAIHQNSLRAKNEFVVVDCAALPENLVESALFGHEKGAFTGADKSHDGLVLKAHRGTLFLDEVGELPLGLQRAFLRVLQERTFRRVGGPKELKSDFRLLAATNRNIDQMVEEGTFRNDLLYRLKSFALELPPLRGRTQDIRDLVFHHMALACEALGIGTKGFSPDFLEALIVYPWPGNVRELVNAVEMAVASARQDPTLYHKHLPNHIRIHLARVPGVRTGPVRRTGHNPLGPWRNAFPCGGPGKYGTEIPEGSYGHDRLGCKKGLRRFQTLPVQTL